MSGRHQAAAAGDRARLGWIAAVLALAISAAMAFGLSPAGAATTVKAQLTLSGLANVDNPVGGSQIGVHPGDTVQISPSAAPTAGLDQLGLGDLLSGVLNSLAGFQIRADFSKLPGGQANTIIKTGTAPLSFTFPKTGTYNFTWTAERVTLLGVAPIDLDGNQLAKAGIKLNASNEYVGQIVVATDPPKGGIGLQLPSVGLHPSVPVLGQLPSIGIPGVRVTVPVSVPNLNPVKPGKTGSTTTKTGGTTAGGAAQPVTGPFQIPVPAQVVPRGGGNGVFAGGGFDTGVLAGTNASLDGASSLNGGAQPNGSTAGATSAKAADQQSSGKHKTIDLASNRPSTGQLSVVLAILAIIALTLVAATYARLYVLRRN